jgi:hypothetical protein
VVTKDPWEWLSLVDIDGPFLSKAALKSVFRTGLDRPFNAIDDVNSTFVYEHTLWAKSWADRHGRTDASGGLGWRDRWVTAVLRDLLQWGEHLVENPDPTLVASSPDGDVTVRPWAALDVGNGTAALVVVVDPMDDLRRFGSDGWAADSIDRTAALLRDTGVTVGLVTDGRWWGIVSAVSGVTTASGVFDALIWREERDSRDAFFALAGLVSLAGGAPEKRLPRLFEASVASAEAITEALGEQVRRAVELVLQAMSESHLRALANGEESPLPGDAKEVYEAAVSVLMRVVFLLFAEERGLLPQHQMYRDSYAIAGVRVDLERQAQNDTEEALDHTWETWHRLLAASTAIYSGATFEDTRMPAYGGTMFNPARFPWLRSTNLQGLLTVPVSDRVMLKVLQAVQIAYVGGEARQLSFRDLDVEQIGYVYEGLLGYSAEYTTDVVVGLHGKSGYEPEIALTELRDLADTSSSGADFAKKLTAHLDQSQGNAKPASARRIAKAFEADDETDALEARARLGYVLLGRTEIVDQLAPLHALIRNDLRDFPYVVPAGGLVMTESPQRANTGTHYTPRSLAEEVVLYALEPLVYSPGPLDTENKDEWVLKGSTEILNLKVADIAVGSGAFLVAAARYLAGRLIEARSKEGLTSDENENVKRWAIREIVARCLYGADINGMAVEMCKLSLWLVSMDPGKPFSFVDDRVFHGNSLLGVTSERQLRAQHIDPGNSHLVQSKLLQLDVESDLGKAAQLRRELSSGQVDDADRMRSTRAKSKLLDDSREVTAKLRDVADGIIAAGLPEGGRLGRALEARYSELADALYEAYPPNRGENDRRKLDAILKAGLTPAADIGEQRWKPLHWIVEAPDVLLDRGGFDAIVGNPPFLGGKRVSGAVGSNVREWLVNQVAYGKKGNADLAANFFLRASQLVRPDTGVLGLIGTNTIAQGETRVVGLLRLTASMRILRSVRSAPWPSKSASLSYAAVWCSMRSPNDRVSVVADGDRVPKISSFLEAQGRVSGEPRRLHENARLVFQGSIVVGRGFVLTGEEREAMLNELDLSKLDEVVVPYLTGEDLNSRPDSSASRFVVNFRDLPLEAAESYGPAFERVERLVKPERQRLNSAGKYVLRKPLPERWWQFAEKSNGLYSRIRGQSHVITMSFVSKAVIPIRIPNHGVFSHRLAVFVDDSYGNLGLLSSSVHQLWATSLSSTLEDRVSYSPSDSFLTLPRPKMSPGLSLCGEKLDRERKEIMLRRELGITALYNRVNDPTIVTDADVNQVRKVHREIDTSMMEAYGWTDIPLEHGFHTYRQMERFTVSPAARVEIFDRLLEENHRRAALEARAGDKAMFAPEIELDPESTPLGAMF